MQFIPTTGKKKVLKCHSDLYPYEKVSGKLLLVTRKIKQLGGGGKNVKNKMEKL
jgi:hypothetical protein